jgi:hypothetical protein
MKNKTKFILTAIFMIISVACIVSLVQAAEQEGCCLDTGSTQCVKTARDECTGRFYTGPPYDCSNVPDCKPGTCIPKQADQPCLRNKQIAECLALGGVPDTRPLEQIEQCKPGCCIVAGGLKAEVLQYRQCENLTRMLGFSPEKMQFIDNITSEIECKKQGSPADLGCCVLGGGKCSYGLRSSCADGRFVPLQGGLYCTDINDCALTTENYYDCGKLPGTETNVYWFDSQGNQEKIKEECDYPDMMCQKTTSGKAVCVPTKCKINKTKGSQEMTGNPPRVSGSFYLTDSLLTGTSMCYNFYTQYGDENMDGRSTGLQNQILHCELGNIRIETLGADRQKLCVQSKEGSLHGNVRENNYKNCSQCGSATGFLAGVRNTVGDFFGPTFGFPGGSVIAAMGGFCNKAKCEALGDCYYHVDFYGPTEIPIVGPAPTGSCDPKYPPGLGSSTCSNCGKGGDDTWNICTKAECYSQGDCQFSPAGSRMLWMTPLMAISLAWAERTPLIPTECLVTSIYCAISNAGASPNPSCTIPKNNNFASCIGDRFSRYTIGVPLELLKKVGLDLIWDKLGGGLKSGFEGIITGFGQDLISGKTGGNSG